MKRIAVIILNYRTPSLAIDCLWSLAGEVDMFPGIRVFAVDNGSEDGSAEQMGQAVATHGWSPWASVIALSRNGGYAAGNNAGIHLALEGEWPADYVMILNPDTVVRPGAIRELVDFMEANPGAGIAGSQLVDEAGRTQCSAHPLPTPLGELGQAARMGPLGRWLGRYSAPLPIRAEACACDWVSGASMMVRREAFESTGLMDEGYFLYFDEVDFCLRARKAGWQCWYVPRSQVVHLEGSATGITRRGRRARYWYDSRRRFFTKHYGLVGLLAADVLWGVGRLILWARWVLRMGGSFDGDPQWFAWDLLGGDLRAVLGGGSRRATR